MKKLALFLMFVFPIAVRASVTVTVNVSSLTGGTIQGAIIQVSIQNCANPTLVKAGTPIPLTQNFYPYNGVATITLYDNVTQIACNGNLLSYYTFNLISQGTTTFIKNVELPPGSFNLANLANVTTPPFNPGIIQGPAGPQGIAGVNTLTGSGSPTATGQTCANPFGTAYLDTSASPNNYWVCGSAGWQELGTGGGGGGVQLSPSTSQTVAQPTGTTLSSTSINGVLNEEAFTGSTIALRVNAAITACGSTPCIITIPSYAPASGITWTTPVANNILINDQRGDNSVGFFANGQPYLHSMSYLSQTLGANSSYESNTNSGKFLLNLDTQAVGGGTSNNASLANAGGMLIATNRSSGNRPVWGADINTGYETSTNTAQSLELDLGNGTGSDDTALNGRGLLIIGGGAGNKRAGVGEYIQGINAGGISSWEYGEIIENYHIFGLEMASYDTGRSADINFLPPADDGGYEMIGRNFANTSNVWTVNDTGDALFHSVSSTTQTNGVNGTIGVLNIYSTAGSANTENSGLTVNWNNTGGTGETDFINSYGAGTGGFRWFNSASSASPGTAEMILDASGNLSTTNGLVAVGPFTSVAGDLVTYSNTTGKIQDSGRAPTVLTGAGHFPVENGTAFVSVPMSGDCTLASSGAITCKLTGTTGTITGTSIANACDSGTATVTGATVGHTVQVSTTDGTDIGANFTLKASVTSSNTVTVYVCNPTAVAATPSSKAYNVVTY